MNTTVFNVFYVEDTTDIKQNITSRKCNQRWLESSDFWSNREQKHTFSVTSEEDVILTYSATTI